MSSTNPPPRRRLANELRAAITSGAYAPGDQLPSERAMAATHGVARNTAREAIRLLSEEGLVTASLDHAMWFHRAPQPGALDGWLLYAQEAGGAGGGRGLGTGRFFTPDGAHLASVAQEGMIRAGATR